MYKKKELLGIMEICKDYPGIDTGCLQEKIKKSLDINKAPKFSTKDKEITYDLYEICMHNGTLHDPVRKSMEDILRLSRIEEKYHKVDIYTEDEFWDAVMNDADELHCGEYGYHTEKAAFEKESVPAGVWMVEYKCKYIVCVYGEIDEAGYVEEQLKDLEHNLFDDYDEAYQYYQSLLHSGIKSGEEQIRECKEKLKEADHIYIKPRFDDYDNISFDIYYKNILFIERLEYLDYSYINHIIEQHHQLQAK